MYCTLLLLTDLKLNLQLIINFWVVQFNLNELHHGFIL